MDMEAYGMWAEMKAGDGTPLFAAEELRRKIIQSQPQFNDLDLDLPPELKEARMMPAPMPMNDDGEGENDEGT